MRGEPYARGGCHLRNNVRATEFPTILEPNVHSSNSIAMRPVATLLAHEVASFGAAFLALPTGWTRLAGVSLLVQHHGHPQALGLVGQQVPDVAKGPLVQALVIGSRLQVLADVAHITDDQHFHALFV